VSDFLAEMAGLSAARCAAARARVSEAELRARLAAMPRAGGIRVEGFSLIAEVKTASPSEGVIASGGRDGANGEAKGSRVVEQARAYAGVEGVCAISVLTEPTRFGGTLEDLGACAAGVGGMRGMASGGGGGVGGVPCMRKDFLVEAYQVLEARAWGAAGVLVIVRMLSDGVLAEMLATADELGMFTVIEAFDEADLERAGRLLEGAGEHGLEARAPRTEAAGQRRGPRLVGVNTRDLVTLRVEPGRLERLAGRFPPGCVRVAESGLSTAEDAARVAGMGYGAALVGTALMRSADPAGLARAMVRAGRFLA
jgi:indole-3-glycerol phosphate synthase